MNVDTLLYLVAHAPAEPWDFFEPDLGTVVPPRSPDPSDRVWEYTPDQQEEVRKWQRGDGPLPKWASDYESAYARYIEVRDDYRIKKEMARRTQWPWWWAKQILSAKP